MRLLIVMDMVIYSALGARIRIVPQGSNVTAHTLIPSSDLMSDLIGPRVPTRAAQPQGRGSAHRQLCSARRQLCSGQHLLPQLWAASPAFSRISNVSQTAAGASNASSRLAMIRLHSCVIGRISNGCSTCTPTSSMPAYVHEHAYAYVCAIGTRIQHARTHTHTYAYTHTHLCRCRRSGRPRRRSWEGPWIQPAPGGARAARAAGSAPEVSK